MATPSTPLSFSAQFALVQTSPTTWSTPYPPKQMGNPLNIAYGGYALALAAKSACLSVPTGYHIYSMLGHYLGPAYCDRVLHASVRTIRQTRTFATREIEVTQIRDDGEKRVCLIAIIDFMVAESDIMMDYSQPPSKKYSHWKNCLPQHKTFQNLVKEGKVTEKQVKAHAKAFSLMADMYVSRPCPEGVFARNLYGFAKTLEHGQEGLEKWERTTADWLKSKEEMGDAVDHIANLTFAIDSAIAFLPLSFGGLWMEDVGACSSLDFSLRFFRNGKESGDDGVDINKWLLREMRSGVASSGRSFGESWIWDEQGRAVACMSQQSILRPKPMRKQKGKL